MPTRTSITRACLPCFAFAASTVLVAANPNAPTPQPSTPTHLIPKKEIPSLSLLPDGSQLHQVMFPRYDQQQKLVATIKAELITLVSRQMISGNQVNLEFYYPDQSPRGHTHFNHLQINQESGVITATEPVRFHSDQFHLTGSALYYNYSHNVGFVSGPVSAWSNTQQKTAMLSRPSSLVKSATLSAAICSSSMANPTPPPSDASPTPTTPAAHTADLKQSLDSSAAITQQVKEFLESNPNEAIKSSSTTPLHQPNSKPLELNPSADDTKINCDGGMYFNADEGVVVFLKNVTVSDPRFDLKGANELKIQLAKKHAPTTKPQDHTKPLNPDKPADFSSNLSNKFGEIDTITATGAVHITYKGTDKDKKPVEASGAIFNYHAQTGVITISGGYPWVMQGSNFMRAMAPNLTLRIQKSGSFTTEGNWQLGGKLEKIK